MAQIDSLGEAEQQAMKELGPKLAAHAAASERAFNTVGLVLAAAPELPISQVRLSRRVATVLMVRLSNDLRGVALLALRGYCLQAASLAASIYEAAHCIAYVGSDDSRAGAWVNHDDPSRSFRNIRTLTNDVARKLGVTDPITASNVQYRVYRQLCLAKHANPLLQQDHGHYSNELAVVAMNGPDVSEASIRVARFALEHATRQTILALANFTDNHVPSGRRSELAARLHGVGQAARDLAQVSIREYGDENPYPGE